MNPARHAAYHSQRRPRVAVGTLVGLAALSLGSSIAIPPVFGEGEAVVELSIDQADRARVWDIAVTGGVASTARLTLEPISGGFLGEFTVAVAGDEATVKLTAELPEDWELTIVGCLDDLDPPTEIEPVVNRVDFAFEVLPDRRYSCFPASFPLEIPEPPKPPADTSPPERHVPATDTGPVSQPVQPRSWAVVLAMSAGLILGTLLVAVRARR